MRNRHWRLIQGTMGVLLAITLIASIAGCATSSTGAGNSNGKAKTVYFATFAIGNAFWGVMQKGAQDAANSLGMKIQWTQSQDFSVQDTVNRMNTAIAAHPDALVVTDVDPNSMEPVMRKAQAAGIAVIDVNAQSADAKPPYLMYIGSNEYLSGRTAAQTVLDSTSGSPIKRAACLIQVQGQAALESRCQGFTDVLSAKGIQVDKVDIAGGPTTAQSNFQAYLLAHPDTGAVYTLSAGPEAFDPVLNVLRSTHNNGKIKFITSDTSQDAFDAIKAGDCLGAIDQQQYLQGYLAVQWAHLYLDYGMLPGNDVLTGPVVVTRATVDQVENLVKDGYR